jgi:sugar phosphate isomerase/epimerase
MNRRRFIRQAAVVAASTTLVAHHIPSFAGTVKKPGVQLWSLPKVLEKDFKKGIASLAAMGYKEVEMYGPYPFSTPEAKRKFQSIIPSIGFSGSGFFEHSAKEVKAILSDNGMKVPSIHTDLDTLRSSAGGMAAAASVLGFTYVCLPAIPAEERTTLDDYKRLAEDFNKIGEQVKKYGMKFGYHNHGYGFKEVDGHVPLYTLLDNTDPNLVFLEMDVYWTVAGGADPITLLDKYPDRYHLMHVKDMKEKKTFSGDGGDPAQWIELFPYMTTAGSGVIDLKAIIAKAKRSGVKHFFVEQDGVADPEAALKASADYLKSI